MSNIGFIGLIVTQYLWVIQGILQQLLDGKNDFDEWHEGQILSVPKRGGLSDTKKCRGVTLMDIEEKYLVVYYLGFHSRS